MHFLAPSDFHVRAHANVCVSVYLSVCLCVCVFVCVCVRGGYSSGHSETVKGHWSLSTKEIFLCTSITFAQCSPRTARGQFMHVVCICIASK